VTPQERRCGWLLRAYPGWYRRERAGEMLDTLLAVSPPGQKWPSFRDAWSLIIGGLRVRGPLAWCLSIPWALVGATGAGYNFILSEHVPDAVTPEALTPGWVGEPNMIAVAAQWGALTWFLLTIPVLVAGLVRLYRRRLGAAGFATGLTAIAWTGTWMVGLALMYQVANWQPTAAPIWSGNCDVGAGCSLAGYRHAVVSWEELAVLAGWLVLGAAMALILTSTRSLRIREIRAISSA
jgi:hypothetical protein